MVTNRNYLYFICSVAVFGGVMFGFDIAIVAGAVPFIQEYFAWNELQLGWGVSSLLVGCVLGSICTGFFTNKYGRKKILLFVAVIFGFSCLGTAIATNGTFFILARFIGGISVGAISVLSPMYVAEIAPSKIRGRLTAIYQLCIMSGILISYIINYLLISVDHNWRWMFASGIVPSILFFVGIVFIPESPRWLCLKGRSKEAKKIFAKLMPQSEIDDQMKIIEASSSTDTKPIGYISLLTNKLYSKSIILGLVLAVLVQLIGSNAALDYAPKIMMAAGFSINDALYFNIFMGVINFFATIFGVIMIDRLGRKPLYFYGSLIMGTSLFFLGFSFSHELPPFLSLCFLFAYIACFSACIGPVFWTFVSEIFPNQIRSIAVALVSFTQWIFNFIVVWLFPHFLASVGGDKTFYFFGVMCLIQLCVVKFFLPETKNKTLEEIEELWATNQSS